METADVKITLRVDRNLKDNAETLFAKLGMNMTTAINVFVRQAVRQRRIPFEVALDTPNAETIAAMREANALAADPKAKRYASFQDLLDEVKADDV